MSDLAPLYAVTREHLDALSDAIGIMQHAIGPYPDPAHGYCTDDVARALHVDLLQQDELGWDAVAASAWRNVRFLGDAFEATTGRFRNFRHADRSWLDGPASDDSQGRAMSALGATIGRAPEPALVEVASRLFAQALPAAQELSPVRARASVMLGCDAAMRSVRTASAARAYRILADRLAATFETNTKTEWRWPEDCLTYENALPVQALIVGGQYFGSTSTLDRGLDVLDWLITSQTDPSGHLSPVGNGWWAHDGAKSRFDQQPIEATALLLAAEAAYEATGEDRYRAAMERAYAWFLGDNDLQVPVAIPERGASFDGLTQRGPNTNQGAESTLMWLIASARIRALRAREAAPPPMSKRLAAAAR